MVFSSSTNIRADTVASQDGFGYVGNTPGYFDIALDENWDLSPNWVIGNDETLQRLKLRLLRELGEWFLDTSAGLPWYQDGHGILGAKLSQQSNVLLLIRRCIMRTEGVKSIEKLTTNYVLGTRALSIYVQVLLDNGTTEELTVPITDSTYTV